MTGTGTLPHTETVTSKDGTTIAFERHGAGPVIVVVDGAMCYREFGPARPFAEVAKGGYTVVCYDRRGRGASGDTLPYSPQREVEDLLAVIGATGTESLLGFSSGAGLAYETAAAGAPVKRVLGYEAPYVGEGDPNHRSKDHLAHLEGLLTDDTDKGRGKAVDYFMTTMVGGPAFLPLMMRLMGKVFRQLKAIAHTLPYDTQVMNSTFTVPRERLAKIAVPTLVVYGGKAKPNMVAAQQAVHEAIAGSELRMLPGQTHQVSNDAILPVAKAFFAD